jgi:hypothetical protein
MLTGRGLGLACRSGVQWNVPWISATICVLWRTITQKSAHCDAMPVKTSSWCAAELSFCLDGRLLLLLDQQGPHVAVTYGF